MIKNEVELQATQERINHFWKMIEAIRKTENNPSNYESSVGGFLAEIAKMNLEVNEFLSFHPSRFEAEQEKDCGIILKTNLQKSLIKEYSV